MPEPNFVEKNGFLVSGKITGLNGVVQPNVLVVISLPVVKGFFDYCMTDSTGTFHFFLKNGFGTADAIFQVFSASGGAFQLELENGALQRKEVVRNEFVTLTSHQTGFVKNALASSFASHIFFPGKLIQSTGFSMSLPDSIPFYGVPDYDIKPGEFIDLPDFREIARELLPGFQYRIKNEKIVFRMINRTRSEFFKTEPLRLINGIPVFDNQLFASLKSTEIEYIDLVLTERIYGDLIIDGVIEVALRDKSNTWLGKQQNLFRKSIDLLQPAKTPNHESQVVRKENEPDTRQVFVWEKSGGETRKISFDLSDRKGIVEISVEGFSSQNSWFKSVKQIEIK